MKKRILSVILSLIMLVSLVPAGAITASAASMYVSENAITVLKQIQNYSSVCKKYGDEYRIGYGTICTCTSGAHGGTHADFDEKVADKALRAKLKELDNAVNSFASNAGVSLNQGQHDALVVFSYDCGTSWLNGTGVLRSAVVNGLTGNAFLNAIGQSADFGNSQNAQYETDLNSLSGVARRMVEANMYLNGAYSNVPPSNYTYVDYNLTEGSMAEGTGGSYRQFYNSSVSVVPSPVPTRGNYIFLGWYEQTEWVPYLTKNQAGETLTAKWQPKNATYRNAVSVNYYLDESQLAKAYAYETPDLDSEREKLDSDEESFRVDRDFIDEDGARWSRLYGNNGWVLVESNGSSSSSSSSTKYDIDVTVTVTNEYVRVRAEDSIYSKELRKAYLGEQLRIVNTASGDGFLWGQIADDDGDGVCEGWVALIYTNWNSVKDSGSSSSNSTAIATAVINCDGGYLNVRSEAGTDNAIVSALADGDKVDIYEIKFVNGHMWGRATSGWVLLTYANVTMLDTNLNYATNADVLAYTFTGTLKVPVYAHVDTSDNSDTIGSRMRAGDVVAMSMVKNDNAGKIWGFNGTGWIRLSDVNMDVAKYVVVADSVTVREMVNGVVNSSSNIVEKVVKGVELDISEIRVVDATIWGYTAKYNGWVNLASKYVQRSNAPTIENAETDPYTGLVATVVNTDSVRVRVHGATYSAVIGSLSRGTTVAVWEANDHEDWYKLDTNQNGVYDYDGDGWVYSQYLDIYQGSTNSSNGSTSGSNGSASSAETGLGIVANTYTGVNVRTAPGTGNAQVGKLLTGSTVEIMEVTTYGASKWGRVSQGWVCMDYITMVSYYPIGGTATDTNTSNTVSGNAGGSTSNTEGNVTTVSTPAVYEGTVIGNDVKVMMSTDVDAQTIRNLAPNSSITLQELVKVTTKTTQVTGTVVDGNGTTETSTVTTDTTYWARVNDGWIKDPEVNIALNPLEEITYTVTGANEVNVRNSANGNTIVTTLDKGTQVTITDLEIVDDKVWGYIEDLSTNGAWVRLDNMSEGAITIQDESANDTTPTTPTTPPLGVGSSTGGFVTNSSGYRYTGKVINTNQVNVRANPSTNAGITTTLNSGAALLVYETTIAENMAWGRCDAGWVYLYYVDLTPAVNGAVDARVVYNENTIAYSDMNCSSVAGTYSRMSVVDIYEIVGKMARTDLGWVNTDNLL